MALVFNPDNTTFRRILSTRYVDKTGLITQFDSTLHTAENLVLSSRPRQFGKSFTAHMFVAFYSSGCDSRKLFSGLEVSRQEGWDLNLNRLNVVYLNVRELIDLVGVNRVVGEAKRLMLTELREEHPEAGMSDAGEGTELTSTMLDVVEITGRRFVFVLDEWDAPYRLAAGSTAIEDEYASLLRSLFKGGTFTGHAVAGAFMLGILPISAYACHTELPDFEEYTMVDPDCHARYVGFTETEVEALCLERGLDYAEVKKYYGGYILHDGEDVIETFSPYSVMKAYRRRRVAPFWPRSEAFKSILPYIEMDLDGLQKKVLDLIGSKSVPIDPYCFQSDLVDINSADEALTLLCHLGYITYDSACGLAQVPNEEVRYGLMLAVRNSHHPELVLRMHESKHLLASLHALNEEAVAEGFSVVHERECTPLFYNSEQALRAVVKLALIAAADTFARFEELPSGHGFADVCYIPKSGIIAPVILIELKWNKLVEAALAQIKNTGYYKGVTDLGFPVLLVDITYEADTPERKHTCKMEIWKG